jgi:hypothetical protein
MRRNAAAFIVCGMHALLLLLLLDAEGRQYSMRSTIPLMMVAADCN